MQGVSHNLFFRLKQISQIWGGNFRVKSKTSENGSKIKNMPFPRTITYCVKKLSVAAGELSTSTMIFLFQEKSRNLEKPSKNQNFDFFEGYKFVYKKLGVTNNVGEFPGVFFIR